MPEFNGPEDITPEVLHDFAYQHQIANQERPRLTVHPSVFKRLVDDLTVRLGDDAASRAVQHQELGLGLRGPNYTVFIDESLLENELDVVRTRDSVAGPPPF